MKFVFYTAAIIILMTFNFSQIRAEKVMRPKFKDIKLWSDAKFITHTITMDSSDPHMNFTLKVVQKLHNVDVHIEAKITRKLDANYFLTLNTTVNLCNLLHYKTKSPLGALISTFLRRYGHILEKCPIVKGVYYLHKIWIPEDPATSTLPEVDFDINFTGYHVDVSNQRTLLMSDHFSGEVVVHDVANVKRGLLDFLPHVLGG